MSHWLCLDIGNTHTVAGLYEVPAAGAGTGPGASAPEPARRALVRFRTDAGATGDEYRAQLLQLFGGDATGIFRGVGRVIVSSVVPALQRAVRAACPASILWISHEARREFDLDLPFPAQLGADRLANVAGATLFSKGPFLIVDAGTATTFCAVAAGAAPGARPVYVGGAIVPGLEVGWKALQSRAAQLFAVELTRPSTTLGRDTESQLQAGVLQGYESLIEGMADRILADGLRAHGARFERPELIATGGCVNLLKLSPRWRSEPDLTLKGLLRYGQLNG